MVGKNQLHSVELNRQIAYQGKIGRQRKDFCIGYIGYKQSVFKSIQQDTLEQTTIKGVTIECHKGCSYCCVVYVEATIQECEAIVYYLYKNDSVLYAFLKIYPEWRENIRSYGDLFEKCVRLLNNRTDLGHNTEEIQTLADSLLFYKMQNIPCPFLLNNICSIYEVRPYLCAAHHVTTPAEWCNPLNAHQPKVYKANLGNEMFDLSFYHASLNKPLITFMPVTVYDILNGGFSFLSSITSIESLHYEVMKDPQIIKILHDNGAL